MKEDQIINASAGYWGSFLHYLLESDGHIILKHLFTIFCEFKRKEIKVEGKDQTVDDQFDLDRFLRAQTGAYERALSELRLGEKRSHWMWYIFPQIDGLGHSTTAKRYAIKSLEEARDYLNHPVLGERLIVCSEATLSIEGRTVQGIFRFPDNLKLRSSMTLFASISETDCIYEQVLDKFFDGQGDKKTLQLVGC